MSEIKVEMGEFPVAYVAQLKFNSDESNRRFHQVNEELKILREVCWCIITSVTDRDDRKYLRDTLKGEE